MQPRTLPHRSEAEFALLGGVLMRGRSGLLEVLDVIGVDDLYQPRAQAVLQAMVAVEQRGEPIDVVTVEAQLRRTGELDLVGGIEGLARLDRYASAHNLKAHAELILDAAQVRNVVVATRELAEEGMGDLDDGKEYVGRARAKIIGIADARTRRSYRSAHQVLLDTMGTIVERKKNADGRTVTGVPTGLIDLDAFTQGLQPTDLVILAARPSMGKTAFALSMGLNASVCRPRHWGLDDAPRLFPTLIFSLEMSANQLMERALAAEAGLQFKDIRSTAPFMRDDMKGLIRAGQRIAEARLAIDDQAGLSIDEIKARTLKWREDPYYFPPDDEEPNPLGMVMVDYLQLARGRRGTKYTSREQEISDISRDLKGLAKEIKMPVIALAQLNRAVDARADHRPVLSDLRESGAIEQDADVIMFIYREERYLAPDAPADKYAAVANKMEIIIGKQRNGALASVHAHFDGSTQRVTNAERRMDYNDL